MVKKHLKETNLEMKENGDNSNLIEKIKGGQT